MPGKSDENRNVSIQEANERSMGMELKSNCRGRMSKNGSSDVKGPATDARQLDVRPTGRFPDRTFPRRTIPPTRGFPRFIICVGKKSCRGTARLPFDAGPADSGICVQNGADRQPYTHKRDSDHSGYYFTTLKVLSLSLCLQCNNIGPLSGL